MPVDLGSLTLWMGPSSVGGPDDLEAVIVDFISGATKTVDVAVQELDHRPIVEALIDRRRAGLVVRVILEADYLGVKRASRTPWIPGADHESNRESLAALQRAGVQVRIDLNPAIFHQKFIVRDAAITGKAAVLAGSTNFTPTGVSVNLNHLIRLKSKRVATVYAEEFKELWTGTFGISRLRDDVPMREYSVAGVRVRILFAPDHAPELEVIKQMLKATTSIDFAMFTFAQSSGIDDALKALHQAGIMVRGVLDGRQANQKWAASHFLLHFGVPIFELTSGPARKLHHKLAVIDQSVTIGGSFNYTGPATNFNDENVLVIGDAFATDPDEIAKQSAVAAYAQAEINRIINQQAEPM